MQLYRMIGQSREARSILHLFAKPHTGFPHPTLTHLLAFNQEQE